MPGSPESFADLYQRATRGESTALDDLLVAYLPRLRAFVRSRMDGALRRRESCSDLVQSVCREVVEERDRFEFRGEAEFRGWLFTAALNKVREKARFHRAQRRDAAREAPVAPDESVDQLAAVYASVGSPSVAAMRQEDILLMEEAIERLPEQYREVITLTRLAGLPQKEVAVLMDRSESAVQKMLGRALMRLGEAMERGRGAAG